MIMGCAIRNMFKIGSRVQGRAARSISPGVMGWSLKKVGQNVPHLKGRAAENRIRRTKTRQFLQSGTEGTNVRENKERITRGLVPVEHYLNWLAQTDLLKHGKAGWNIKSSTEMERKRERERERKKKEMYRWKRIKQSTSNSSICAFFEKSVFGKYQVQNCASW
jgi:hypothetical protein